MTAGDIPVTTGNPDQGFEGYRFVGYNLYDSLVLWDPYWAPAGSNWGHYENSDAEALIKEIFNEFDEEKRLGLLTNLHELEGRDAVMIFVVHDLNPRAMSPKVKGFVQAQSWFQDLTPVTIEP